MAEEQKPAKPNQLPRDHASEITSLKDQVARLESLLMQQIQSTPKISPDTLWAQNHEREMKIRNELDRLAELFLESTQSRTQWEANKLNPEGKRLYKVQVGWCPEVIVRANDDITAKAYYDRICGIRGVSTNHGDPTKTTYTIVEVTNDPEAQKLSKSDWESKTAA